MGNEILQSIKNELVNGTIKRGHPFRFFSLGTVHKTRIRQRTVVLRKVSKDFELRFYTDSRSEKVKDILQNTYVSALFYHPKKMLQLRIEGQATLMKEEAYLKRLWQNIPESSKKDYTGSCAPGTVLDTEDVMGHIPEKPHFCVIDVIPSRIEYLKLQRPNHQRMLFSYSKEGWNSDFLAP